MIEVERDAARLRLRLLLGAWRSLVRKIDSQRSRLTVATRLSYWLSGSGHSILSFLQERSYADAIKNAVPFPPIFVLGFWRSGTTFLHELLCCDPRLGFPSTYACLNPSHFLLSEQWMRNRSQPPTTRPMDDLRYSWSSPQEDEFAVLLFGAPSVYEALLVPSLLRGPSALLDLGAQPIEKRDRWVAVFTYFLRLLTVQQGKPMVLKSPAHGYRIPTLRLLFPEARYVIIERNPYEVFASNLRLWRTLIDRYSLEYCSANEIDQFVLVAYVLHEQIITEETRHLRGIVRVRYEKLASNPIHEMARVYEELQLGDFEIVRRPLEKYMARVSGHVRNHFTLSHAQKNLIDTTWARLIKEKAYTWPEASIDLQ